MICGNTPFNSFPYRTSSYLTRFFEDIDLPYVHDGSTRSWWVRTVLTELNSKPSDDEMLPSKEIIKVIEYLLHPDHFVSNTNSSQPKAFELINTTLRPYELELDPKTNIATLRSTNGNFISTAIDRSSSKFITFTPDVFAVPDKEVQENLVSVMMPLAAEFDDVYAAIKASCTANNVICYRADDIWENTAIVQDIFSLLFCCRIVIVDYTRS